MTKQFPPNVIRYVIVFIIAGIWGKELFIPNYGKQISEYVQGCTPFQIDVITYTGIVLPLFFVVLGGILADKYGRKLVWAVFLLLYGGCMFWLQILAPSGILTTFVPALTVAVFISLSFVFVSSPLAWLFDYEGNDGMKNAYGLLRILMGVSALVIVGIKFMGNADIFSQITTEIAVISSLLVVLMGLWVLTFPENYGTRSLSLPQIAQSGISQFLLGKILPLVVLQAVFIEISAWARVLSFFSFGEAFDLTPERINTFLSLEYVGAFLCAGIFLVFLRKIEYKKLILYPLVCAVIFSVVMWFSPTPLVFFVLRGGITTFLIVEWVGLLIFVNDSITENRATTLSLLILFMTVVKLAGSHLVEPLFGLGWETLSLVSGGCLLGSLGILFVALRIYHQRGTQ